jgi:Right handed beta helix region
MIRTTIVMAAGLALAATLLPAPAQAAGAPRTFLSAAGSDSNNCINVATPCRHLAAAFAATAEDGEIYVLDPANYGSLTITHGVSIEGHGWASIAPVSGSPAITITAGNFDKINIIGVVLDGTALAGTTGILFNYGDSLTVRDSVIRNFGGDGIDFKPTGNAHLWVSNTLVSDNGSAGIAIYPTDQYGAEVTINHVEINNNGNYGVFLWGAANPGGQIAPIAATVSESISSRSLIAFYALTDASHSKISLNLFHSIAENNFTGLKADGGGAVITAAQSMVIGSSEDVATPNNGIVQSFGDNYFDQQSLNLPNINKQ